MPNLTRRAFIARTSVAAGGVAAAGLAAAACTSSDDEADDDSAAADSGDGDGAAFDPSDWASVRAQFPATNSRAQFSAWVLATHPRQVAEAIEEHRDGLDEQTQRYLASAELEAETAVTTAAAEYLGAQPLEIGLTDSTTMGLGLLYGGLRVRPDQQVLTTEHDFYSTHQAWSLRSARDGVKVERVALYDDPAEATEGDVVDRLMAGVTDTTRVVAITWVHSGTGVKLPVRAIADALDAANQGRAPEDRALLCVDGVHGLGVEDVTVRDLGCDFLVSGTHKWLFGPRGTGIVWGRSEAWAAVDPVIPAFEPGSFGEWRNGTDPEPMSGLRFTPGGYHSFEHRWALAQALRFHRDIGKDRVAARTHQQATRLKEGLAEIDGVTLVTPLDEAMSAGIVCFDVDGAAPPDVLGTLSSAGVDASITPYREEHVRVGPSIVTSPEECDTLLEALAQ
ncbi:MAG TPA: aminotransferase class V-fold PLP-dependent enzyme [Acidimicrobiales bacterium]|jgi:selenocysteine lyase/cysteine desulfurase|nr:aminotransferase class V-fold PLP-dependent enzyme [Acidimicrobiales bacterium]